jgi:hypothetical protein
VPALAQPANDLCSGALPMSLNTVYYGNNSAATSTNDGPAPSCQSSFGKSVWYTFNPPVSGNYQVSMCGTTYDSVVSVFDVVDCTTFVSATFHQLSGGCDDDSCGTSPGFGTSSGNASLIQSLALTAGTNYYIRVSGFSTNGGAYQVAVFDISAAGACCSSTGVCTSVVASSCSTTGTAYFLGSGTVCSPNPCVGACCNNTNGTCAATQPGSANCVSGNTWFGYGTSCTPSPCPFGACCKADGTCATTNTSTCTSVGLYGGNGSTCPPGGPACAASIGRCCNGATCTVTDSTSCSTLFVAGGTCTTNLCSFPCCDVLTGACTTVAAGSTCSGVSGAGGATCSTITCAPPANDLCANAQVIPGSGPFPLSVFGQNVTATDTTVLSPTITPCGGSSASSSSRDVFYSFTPAQTRTYTFTLCNAYTGTLDTIMSIHTACPASNANNLMCNDDGCSGTAGPSAIGGFSMTAGTPYIIRVARWSTGSGGKFQLDVTTEAFGACCDTTSACLAKGISQCGSPNVFIGDGTTCATSGICNGACCVAASGSCTYTTVSGCTGTHGGIGSVCTAAFCPSTSCCNDTTGACTTTGTDPCAAGTTPNASATCSPTPCPISLCCDTVSGACTTTGAAACPGGTTPQSGTACSPNPCAGACCDAAGCCTLTGSAGCGGTFQSLGSVCTVNPCPFAPGATCTNPIAITLNSPLAGDLSSYGSCASSTISCSSGVKGTWYSFTAPTAGTYAIVSTLTSGTGNPSIGVFSACGTEIACNNPCGGTQTIVNQVLTAGQQILFRAGGCADTQLTWSVNVGISGACCDAGTGVCTSSTGGAAGCPAGNSYQGDGTSCTPNNCPQPPPPSNDTCAGAIALTINVAYQGSNVTATDDASNIPTCQSNSHKGVWFTFTPAVSGDYLVSSCGSTFDCILSVWSGADCNSLTSVACDDDSCDGSAAGSDVPNPGPSDPGAGTAAKIASVTLTAGQTYRIMLSSYSTNSGSFGIVVQCPTCPTGVCCRGATCSTSITSPAACSASIPAGSVAGAYFATTGSTCNGGSTTSPCCYPDYNKVGGITVGDIFDFLNDWFAGSKFANPGGDGVHGALSVQNIFDYLNAWFAGGC